MNGYWILMRISNAYTAEGSTMSQSPPGSLPWILLKGIYLPLFKSYLLEPVGNVDSRYFWSNGCSFFREYPLFPWI
jgi:hypothetical protein